MTFIEKNVTTEFFFLSLTVMWNSALINRTFIAFFLILQTVERWFTLFVLLYHNFTHVPTAVPLNCHMLGLLI